MSKDDHDIHQSVADISVVFDHALAVAAQKVHRPDEASENLLFRNTVTGVHLFQSAGEIREVELSFEGENAAVIARPVHRLINDHISSRRYGGSDHDRSIKAQGTEREIERAGSSLAAFAAAVKKPEIRDEIERMITLALGLERTIACKVDIRFDTVDGDVIPVVDHIITEPHSVLVSKLLGQKAIQIEGYGPWKTSDMRSVAEGVVVRITGPEGQVAFERAAEDIISLKLTGPVPQRPLRLPKATLE